LTDVMHFDRRNSLSNRVLKKGSGADVD